MDNAPPAFYERLGASVFRATTATTSPWDESLQHGGPPSALLATSMLAEHPRQDMRLAKITVDFLGGIPRRDVSVSTRVVRPGKRIELLDGTLSCRGQDVAYARAWRVGYANSRLSSDKNGHTDMPPNVPPPQEQRYFKGLDYAGYGQAIEWRFVEGGFEEMGPAAAWTRVRLPLTDDQCINGLQRVLIVADAANGLSAQLPISEYLFVPPSLTVTLVRPPQGEWIFIEARSDIASDGVGVTGARLFDLDGFLGTVSQCLFVDKR